MRRRNLYLCLCLGLLAAPGIRAEQPDQGAALAAAIERHRALATEAQGLVEASEHGSEVANLTGAIDAQRAALVEQGLLEEGAPGQGEAGGTAGGQTAPAQSKVLEMAPGPPSGDAEALDRIGRFVANDSRRILIEKQWEAAVQQAGKSADVTGMVQYVLREAHLESSRRLKRPTDRVKHLEEQQTKLRDRLGRLREPAEDTAETEAAKREEEREALEAKLAKVEEDAKRANAHLIGLLRKQQQALQAMVSVAGMLNETGMATVRKIGG